jgi:ketosteroid isomerase-like protein
MWDEGSYEWGELIEAGPDKLVSNQRRELRGSASGAPVAWAYWVVLTFRNGKVLRFEWFDERIEALEAAGLSGVAQKYRFGRNRGIRSSAPVQARCQRR